MNKILIGLTLLFVFMPVFASAAIIVDHISAAQFDNIPVEWINAAKANLHIAYGHTSHGSQLITGMNMLLAERGTLYSWNNGGTGGALDLKDYPGNFGGLQIANDLGASYTAPNNYTAWATATRAYLNQNPGINVIIWSWCYQMNTDAATINLYLNQMRDLERDFPNVKFVYMTGHVTEGQLLCTDTRWACVHNLRCTQIRNFVQANNGILYDFADIESYDPSGNYFGDKLVTDACTYDSNGDGAVDRNWATDWCSAHPDSGTGCDNSYNVPWQQCAHSQGLNCYMKGKAAWWLWARLAGWDGGTGLPIACTAADWSYVDGSCRSNNTLIRTWTKTNANCQGGVAHPSSESVACQYAGVPGDISGDSKIDVSDLVIIAINFNKRLGVNADFNPAFDVTNDGVIDIADLVFVARRYTG